MKDRRNEIKEELEKNGMLLGFFLREYLGMTRQAYFARWERKSWTRVQLAALNRHLKTVTGVEFNIKNY